MEDGTLLRSHRHFTKKGFILLLSSWVDHRRPKQRPQFTYGHGLKKDLSNAGVDVNEWGSLSMNRNLWHAITKQKNVHCKSNGGGYAWMDESESEDAAAERILPLPSSYAGVILGLSSASAPGPQSPRNVIVPSANSNRNHLNIQPTVTQVLSPQANSYYNLLSNHFSRTSAMQSISVQSYCNSPPCSGEY
jgi:hypothetical protein